MFFCAFLASCASPNAALEEILPENQVVPTQTAVLRIPTTSSTTESFEVNEAPLRWQGLLLALPDKSLVLLNPEASQASYIQLPAQISFDKLQEAISPDGNLLILNDANDLTNRKLMIWNLPDQKIVDSTSLTLGAAVDYDALFKSLSKEISDEMIKKGLGSWALEEGYQDSFNKSWWSNNSQEYFYVDTDEDGYTHLFIKDLNAQFGKQLEGEPFFVESLLPSPDGSLFLLRKGVNPAFSSPKLTHFFLVDSNRAVTPISLPELPNTAYWKVYWHYDNSLLFLPYNSFHLYYTHLLHYQTIRQEWKTLWDQPFHQWVELGNKQFFLQITSAKSWIYVVEDGQLLKSKQINAICPSMETSKSLPLNIIVNCNDLISPQYVFNEEGNLNPAKLPEVQSSSSASGQWTLKMNLHQGETENLLILTNTVTDQTWELQADDFGQAFWSPDETNLFFTSPDGLFMVDLTNGNLVKLMENNFDNYPDLDAVWVGYQ